MQKQIVNLARSKATNYSYTINGLLTKRVELYNEAEKARGRIAKIKN